MPQKPKYYNPNNFEPWSDKMTQNFFDHDYQDCGMLKWQGFFLSDHTAALTRTEQESHKTIVRRPQQDHQMIFDTLLDAHDKGKPVAVQMNGIDADLKLQADHVGAVRYLDEGTVSIGQEDLLLEEVRNVKPI